MHNQLYKVEIIEQIPHFHKLFGKKDVYCLHCMTGKKPVVTIDFDRPKDVETDKKFTQQLLSSWAETRDKDENHWFARLRNRGSEYYKTVATLINDTLSADEA